MMRGLLWVAMGTAVGVLIPGAGVRVGVSLTSIPPRPADARPGNQVMAALADLPLRERDERLLEEIAGGNLPQFLRRFVPIEVGAEIDGERRTARYRVAPDYLAVGSDEDFVRAPMMPWTAQRIADRFGCLLPTRKMVDDIWAAAPAHLRPRPIHPRNVDITRVSTFVQSNSYIESQRMGFPLGTLLAGIKKDVVITPRLAARPDRVAIYGWHHRNGRPIQPLHLGHVYWHVDYSHGIRLVAQEMEVDGRPMRVQEMLRDPKWCVLLSDEGAIEEPRYSPPEA